jgi:cytoskeletal protein CcmA (bactofilin family)
VVKGDIVAERLSIEENATIKGKVELSEIAARTGSGQRQGVDLAAPTATPSARL